MFIGVREEEAFPGPGGTFGTSPVIYHGVNFSPHSGRVQSIASDRRIPEATIFRGYRQGSLPAAKFGLDIGPMILRAYLSAA